MSLIFRQLVLLSALVFGSLSFSAQAFADEPQIYTSWRDNVAVGGYDVVSFYSGIPLEGSSDHILAHKGAVWQFSTEANLELFRNNPDAFVPQYGGYCAWAVARGKLAKGSPKYWNVTDGKLYLNFNKRIKKRWSKNIPGFIEKADDNWPEILED